MSSTSNLGTTRSDDGTLLGLLLGIGLFLIGLLGGAAMLGDGGSPLGALVLLTGIVGGVVVLAFAYA